MLTTNMGEDIVLMPLRSPRFSQEEVRVQGRYDTLRVIREVWEEERWLDQACDRPSQKEAVIERSTPALKELKQPVSRSVQRVNCYFSDKVSFVLWTLFKWRSYQLVHIQVLWCSKWMSWKRTLYMLPNDISMNFWESAVCNLFANVDMTTVDLIFLPMHLHGNH